MGAKYEGELEALDAVLGRLCLRTGKKHAAYGTTPKVGDTFLEVVKKKVRIAVAREEGGGFFTNAYPFSKTLMSRETFREYIIDLGAVALDAFEHGKKTVHDYMAKAH